MNPVVDAYKAANEHAEILDQPEGPSRMVVEALRSIMRESFVAGAIWYDKQLKEQRGELP